MKRTLRAVHICGTATFKKGDPRPDGYLDWHEWAQTQYRVGLRQSSCRVCGKYHFPQELDEARYAAGVAICKECVTC